MYSNAPSVGQFSGLGDQARRTGNLEAKIAHSEGSPALLALWGVEGLGDLRLEQDDLVMLSSPEGRNMSIYRKRSRTTSHTVGKRNSIAIGLEITHRRQKHRSPGNAIVPVICCCLHELPSHL
jgi:hypothetical protein